MVPQEVRKFILECIDSVAQLEALVLLHESPQQDWTVQDLARRLYVEVGEAAKILSGLLICELAATDGRVFRYHARDAEHHVLIERVVQTYATCLIPLTTLIHDKASGPRKFADALKVRRDK